MNQQNKKYLFIIPLVAVLLLVLTTVAINGMESTYSAFALATKLQQQTTTCSSEKLCDGAFSPEKQVGRTTTFRTGSQIDTVTGTYVGVVIVSEPAELGSLDLVFNITSRDSTITGNVDAARTQVFLGGPVITGNIAAGSSITPTIRLDSKTFDSVVSGREVQRQFTLTGDILDKGNKLQGKYTETIIGFTPKPLQVTGTFLVVRLEGPDQVIVDPSDDSTATPTATQPSQNNPPTATPTSTATQPNQNNLPTATPTPTTVATRPNNDGQGDRNNAIFLPLVANHGGSIRGAAANPAHLVATPVPRDNRAELRLMPIPTDQGGTATLPPFSIYLPIVANE